MSKRAPDKSWTRDNNEADEYENEEAGVFKKATDESIKERTIRVAKRRSVPGEIPQRAGIFAGFGGFNTSSSATGNGQAAPPPASSKPQLPTFPPATATAFPPLPSAFTGFIATPPPTVDQPPTVIPPPTVTQVANSGSTNGNTTEVENPKFLAALYKLNTSMVQHCNDHMDKNPYIDLRPVFADYAKYFAEFEERYGVNASGQESKKEEPVKSARVDTAPPARVRFDVVEKARNEASLLRSEKPAPTSGSATGCRFPPPGVTGLSKSVPAGPLTFGFGSRVKFPENPVTVSLPGQKISDPGSFWEAPTTLPFFAQEGSPMSVQSLTTAPKTADSRPHVPIPPSSGEWTSTPFDQDAEEDVPRKAPAPKPGPFSFGLGITDTPPKPFDFGQKRDLSGSKAAIVGKSGETGSKIPAPFTSALKEPLKPFSFGLPADTGKTGPQSGSKPVVPGSKTGGDESPFELMTKEPEKPAPAAAGFVLAEAPPQVAVQPLASTAGFSFAASVANAAKKPDGGQAAAKAGPSAGDEPTDEPPKVEIAEFEEENCVYSVRCKLFQMKDKNYVEKGVGTLYLKTTENGKTQLLVRAGTKLGGSFCLYSCLHRG